LRAIVSESIERRRLQRVKLLEPLAARIEGQRVFILDLSRQGLRVAHSESFGLHGEIHNIEFEWDGHHVALEATLRHSRKQRVGSGAYARSVYHSGFIIIRMTPRSEQALRAMIAWHVERALDEQKANARGVPAIAARSFQTGIGKDFVRHIYSAGLWHTAHTTEGRQPANGFTISATESRQEIEMLRSAWEAGDGAARSIIQKMAELSISRVDGIPTRRYTP
jgi:hypothetical protein